MQILFTVQGILGYLVVKDGAWRRISNILPEDLSRAVRFLFMCEYVPFEIENPSCNRPP